MSRKPDRLLDGVQLPADLRRLAEGSLPVLAAELRETLIDGVSRGGGHLASGLGALELT
ncbi:MAG: 1-deoxy-D-xylulose-5-phosphate synthase N-terminal domain-containing protein, partial [Steroidobacteraceae bacterium]